MSLKMCAGEQLQCPKCGSTDIAKAPRTAYRDLLFVVKRPYQCRACGALFETPSPTWMCVAGFGIGASGLVACLAHAVQVARVLLLGQGWHELPFLALDLVAIPVALWIALVSASTAIWSVRARRGTRRT